jgi:dihydroxyacetone kinase-like protein
MELYLMVSSARRILDGRGLKVARHLTGSLVTSIDMSGCSITLSVVDDEARKLWDDPVHTAALRWGM